MTPFIEAGYKLQDKFRVVENDVDDTGYTTEDIIILHEDDDTSMPLFSLLNGEEERFVQLKNIVKIDENKCRSV